MYDWHTPYMSPLFTVIAAIVPLLIYVGMPKFFGTTAHRQLLAIAGILFFASHWVPSPDVNGMQTQFLTHLIGGGIFTGFVWLYIIRVKGLTDEWYIEMATLFALVSSLGVLNELFEFVLYQFGMMPHGIADTSWDLVANTLGALIFYGLYKLTQRNR
ncbi:hypothetical protein KDA14_06155 [Candidatus Saccharibacteria bacterium]|nr:hypothetical protein [Candidatus Saccharibacteria bacterium]